MSAPGWFPDPAGTPGRFRYWDGKTWSQVTTDNPAGTPPPPPSGGAGGPGAPGGRSKLLWPILGVVVALALIASVVWVVGNLRGGGGDGPGTSGRKPSPSQDVCPQDDTPIESRTPQPNDGRVHGGRLSFPKQGPPWSAPKPDNRIAFGRDATHQDIVIEQDPTWVAGIFVADLVAGDGFFGPEQGAAVVLKCITGSFYGDTDISRDDQRSEAIKVDGHDAWVIETWLGFDVPGVEAKREYVIVVIVETEPGAAAVYFASIPENAEQYIKPAQDLIGQLKVSD
ncbi:DUF2510 domain-containing protein [Enemella sp. A6]|uniref:DUF2510 domain-containing protein n=1 Tax=Enemella sp. A6 TaxID=3440152 RepID=UPI003EB73521